MTSEQIVAYSDGSALGNPGPGGWAFWIHEGCWSAGGESHSTNNRMELKACIEIIRYVDPDVNLEIRSDSRYLIDSIDPVRGWIHGWKRRDWRKSNGVVISNLELFKEMDSLLNLRRGELTLRWVRGHSGEPGNERVDLLARMAATRARAGDLLTRQNHS
jgi:ribonuclease HI